MTRILVMSIFLAAACDVGVIPINNGQVDSGTGGSDTGGSNDAGGNGCAAVVAPAPPKHIHITGGTTNKGQNCMAAGACHGAGGAGGAFTWAGTVFAATTGTAPNPGAQVRVKFGAMTLQATTDEDGNFSSTQAVTYPAKTNATKCPSVTPMVSNLVVPGNGQCNSCHVTGGTTAQLVIN